MDRDQVAYVPELFDIHVMAFADDSEVTVQALQDIFHIQRSDAQRLIVDAPVVVKRAATPDLADVLLDALQQIGAQVVIMPARERERPRAAAPAPQAFAATPPAAAPAPSPPATSAANWGGLDLGTDRARQQQHTPTEPWKRFSSMPAALGGGGEDFEPDDATTNSDPLELDMQQEGANARMRAALAAADRGRAMAPAAELSLPPSARKSLRSAAAKSLPPAARRADGFERGPQSNSLAPMSLAPAQRDAASLRPSPPPTPASPLPPHAKRAQPPPPPGAAPPRPPPPPRKPGMPPPPPPQAGTDLGLGTVPPLPPLLSAPDGSALRSSLPAPRSSFRPVISERPRFQHREMEAGPELHLPRIDISTPLLRPTAPAEPPANASAPKASAASSTTKDKESALAAPNTRANAATREPSQRIATESAAKKPVEAPAAEKPRAVPARGRALLEIGAGLLVFYLGLHMDNSILHGDASITWLILHAFGLYAIGSGIAGLWPS